MFSKIGKPSAKRKRVPVHPRIEEFDLEGAVGNFTVLPNELVKPLVRDHSGSIGTYIGAMYIAGRATIHGDAEPHSATVRFGSKHEVEVTRVEAIDEASRPLVQDSHL
jgi:hypothetical protein